MATMKQNILTSLLTLGLLPSAEAFENAEKGTEIHAQYETYKVKIEPPMMKFMADPYILDNYDYLFDRSESRPYKRPSQKKRRINQRRANSNRF